MIRLANLVGKLPSDLSAMSPRTSILWAENFIFGNLEKAFELTFFE